LKFIEVLRRTAVAAHNQKPLQIREYQNDFDISNFKVTFAK
jgi:hypothetical protein